MRFRRPSVRALLLLLYVVTIVVVAIDKAHSHRGPDNNFLIFRWSFLNLRAGTDLYAPHPEQYLDLYKYSPSFAVLFAPFSLLPFGLALALWDALNALLLWLALDRLLPGRRGALAIALVYLEVLRSMQRSQSNALVAALVVLAYLAFEHRRQFGAAVAIAVGAAVKIFPLGALLFALFHPRKWRFALIFAATMAAVIALPLLVVSPHDLVAAYRSWHAREALDALSVGGRGGGGLYGGVMEQLRIWLGVDWPNWPVQLAGTLVLLLPLAVGGGPRRWRDPDFRRRLLASMLVYMVIFNHQSESPSFVIAVTGIAIWFVSTPRTRLHVALMALTILVVSISSTDITPHWLQRDVFVRYKLKTLPCFFAWLVMQAELLGVGAGARALPEQLELPEVNELDVPAREARAYLG
jgi:hypothetical protein